MKKNQSTQKSDQWLPGGRGWGKRCELLKMVEVFCVLIVVVVIRVCCVSLVKLIELCIKMGEMCAM